MRIFAFFRRMLARVAVSELFNSVVKDIVVSRIVFGLRRMEKNFRKKGMVEDAQKAGELAALYGEYASGDKLGKFGKDISANIAAVLRAHGFESEDDVQDAAQEIIASFYSKRVMQRLNIRTGPVGFFKFMIHIARQDTLAYIKSRQRHHQREVQLTTMDEDDREFEEREMAKAIQDPSSFLDEVMSRDVLRDLHRFMKKYLKKEWQDELFQEWMRIVSHGSKVNMNRDLAQPIAEKYKIPFSTVTHYIQQFKKYIAEFFKAQYDYAHTAAYSHTASVIERVAVAEIRHRLADWVLPSNIICRRVLFS